jgi:glutaredoxin
MNPTKKLAIAFLLFAAASIFSINALTKEKNDDPINNKTAKMVLYYGNTCPHCKIVEEYIENNNFSEKIEQKEIFANEANRNEMTKTIKSCGLDTNGNLYVPMLWDIETGKCYGGQVDKGSEEIINFLANKYEIK